MNTERFTINGVEFVINHQSGISGGERVSIVTYWADNKLCERPMDFKFAIRAAIGQHSSYANNQIREAMRMVDMKDGKPCWFDIRNLPYKFD